MSLLWLPTSHAKVEQYAQMAEQVRLARLAINRREFVPKPLFDSVIHKVDWLGEMSERLKSRVPDFRVRLEIINSIRYEAQRVGLDPQLVFAIIEVESNFNYSAVSTAGAIGLMQIMPFWTETLANGDKNSLYHPLLNIRYGCLILAHYLSIERGNLVNALARYNGSLGKSTYPDKVLAKLKENWAYGPPVVDMAEGGARDSCPSWMREHFRQSC